MPRFLTRLTLPAVTVFIIGAFVATVEGLCVGLRVESPPSVDLLSRLTLFCALAWWIHQDSRKRQFPWPYDMGFFLYIAWPFILPYYLFKTRGIKALLLLGAFFGVLVIALIGGVASGLLLATSL
jgi:hypothetical protein